MPLPPRPKIKVGRITTYPDVPAFVLEKPFVCNDDTIREAIKSELDITGPGSTGLPEAPLDGTQYARKDGAWSEVDIPATSTILLPSGVHILGDIPDSWAYGSTDTGLILGNSVTTIGSSAFYRCYGLTGALTIPNSVTTIGSSAFYNCSGLTSLTIPNSVTTIGNSAFSRCSGLTGVNCRITKSVFDATDGASDMFTGTSSSLVLHALPSTGWTAGTNLSVGGNTSVDVVLDLT